jgi:hypothetical protein
MNIDTVKSASIILGLAGINNFSLIYFMLELSPAPTNLITVGDGFVKFAKLIRRSFKSKNQWSS